MKVAKLSSIFVGVSLLVSPMLALAGDFVIKNDTKNYLSFFINGVCASQFGLIPAGVTRAVPKPKLKDACGNNCNAQVYNSSNCSGTLAANISLNVDKGVTQGTASRGYTLAYSYMRMVLTQTI